MTPSDFARICFPRVNCSRGAPMGRGSDPVSDRPTGVRVYDRWLPMSGAGDYDKGGAYWGCGSRAFVYMRVEFTADGSYVRYYRRTR